jgi:hypothetical protein
MQSPIWHLVWMPTTLLPAVGKAIQICPNVTGPENHSQSECQEAGTHNECCGRVIWAYVCHGSRVPEKSLVSTAQPAKKNSCVEKMSRGLAHLCTATNEAAPCFAVFEAWAPPASTPRFSVTYNASNFVLFTCVPNRLHRFHGAGYLHFITTSCNHRSALAGSWRIEIGDGAGGRKGSRKISRCGPRGAHPSKTAKGEAAPAVAVQRSASPQCSIPQLQQFVLLVNGFGVSGRRKKLHLVSSHGQPPAGAVIIGTYCHRHLLS